jgi:hypothetical protein
MSEFSLDQHGQIKLNPVLGWTTGTAAGIGVLLAIEYAGNEAEMEAMKGSLLQLVLTPQQSLELAGRLTILAKQILDVSSGTTKQ